MQKILQILKLYSELAKLRITLSVAISAMLGFILAGGGLSDMLLTTVLGVFLLACGSGALNQLQEIKYDSKMKRTAKRPLPTFQISREEALIFVLASSILGIFLISLSLNSLAIGLGLLSFFWYNAVYTPLKRKTALAVFPGALLGALPPMIGWTAAGGTLFDLQIWALATFFFIWQIPHFWFLFLIYDEEYRKAGYPTLTQMLSEKQIMRISFAWIAALATSSMLVPFFGITSSLTAYLLLFASGALLLWRTKGLVSRFYSTTQIAAYRFAFRDINIYVLLVVIILSFDKLLNH